jgi:hypothetical protein
MIETIARKALVQIEKSVFADEGLVLLRVENDPVLVVNPANPGRPTHTLTLTDESVNPENHASAAPRLAPWGNRP